MGVSDRPACGRGRAEPRHSSDTSPSGRHRPGSNQQAMDATPSTQSCYRRCNSARLTHHTVLPVRARPTLTVDPGFASYNIRKALVCRQFRRFAGRVDVFRTCAIPAAVWGSSQRAATESVGPSPCRLGISGRSAQGRRPDPGPRRVDCPPLQTSHLAIATLVSASIPASSALRP